MRGAGSGGINRGLRAAIIVIFVLAVFGYFIKYGTGDFEKFLGLSDSGVNPVPVHQETYIPSAPLEMVRFDNAQAAVQGQYFVRQLPARGGKPPYAWTLVAGDLPPGLSLTSGGRIVGTPAVNGTFSYLLKVTDANGTRVTNEFTQHVVLPSLDGQLDYLVSDHFDPLMESDHPWFAPTGVNTSVFNFLLGSSKAGMKVYGADMYRAELDKTLVFGNSTGYAPVASIAYVPFAQGGTPPWTFTVAGLPDGISFDPGTGLIYGTLNYSIKTPIWVTLKDSTGKQAIGSPASGSIQIDISTQQASGGGGGGGGGGAVRKYCSTGYCYTSGYCCPNYARFWCKDGCYNSAGADAKGCYNRQSICY